MARRSRGGQSILIAIAVLFMLAFLGALFITIVARAIQNTTLHNATADLDVFAQAGVEYADKMLTTSPQGADWRPPLTYQFATTAGVGTPLPDSGAYPFSPCVLVSSQQCWNYNVQVTQNGLQAVKGPSSPSTQYTTTNISDPDYYYLQQGFTRYNIPGGRFLLRLTYQDYPLTTVPTGQSKYIKIESVGLEGNVNGDDPTTYINAAPTGNQPLRRAIRVAYKPIMLPDTALYITNLNNLPGPVALGVESVNNGSGITTPGAYDFAAAGTPSSITQYAIPTTFGSSTAYHTPNSPTVTTQGSVAGGGSIWSNIGIVFHGSVIDYLDNVYHAEGIAVAGPIYLDGWSNQSGAPPVPTSLQLFTPNAANPTTTNAAVTAFPSNSPNFSTFLGILRDNSANTDTSGSPRYIQRVNPPSIEVNDPSTNLTRYQELTNSEQPGSSALPGPYSTGGNGMPASVFIDNTGDTQAESQVSTLREEWLNPAPSTISSHWNGDFYIPPAAQIVFGLVPGVGRWGFTVTRTDTTQNGANPVWTWTGSDGQVHSNTVASRMRFIYAAAPASPPAFDPTDPVFYLNANNPSYPFLPPGSNPTTGGIPANPNNDIVIYAEGNIRVRGTISDPYGYNASTNPDGSDPSTGAYIDHHVTLVTAGIAYIDGSILKGDYIDDNGTSTTPAVDAAPFDPGATPSYSNSSIAILAHSYVTVNTTQFFAGPEDYSATLTNPNVPQVDESSVGSAYVIGPGQSLSEAFTIPALYNAYATPALFISESGDTGDAYGEISAAFTTPGFSGTPTTILDESAVPPVGGSPAQSGQLFDRVTPLTMAPFAGGGYELEQGDLTYQINQTASANNWLLHRKAIMPQDIRIEANLYSENNSFFVIPGPWFNDDAQDTIDKSANRGSNPNFTGADAVNAEFPLYGQPVDVQITIYGSVSENLPADIGDQSAWMQKWGWIPKWYGTSGTETGHFAYQVAQNPSANIGIGLNFVYDPMEGYGYHDYLFGGQDHVFYGRVDAFGRALPFAPDLPVSPDLIYSGTESEQNYNL